MTGLEALETISKVDYCFLEGELDGFFGMFSEEYNIIKKELKAIEIIKETCDIFFQEVKECNVYRIVFKRKNSRIQNYGCAFETSKEKYDLLQEVLL